MPYDLIQSNNAIAITFPDNGGHISTVTMQVFNFSSDFRNTSLNVEEPNNESIEIKAFPNPTSGIINFSKPIYFKKASVYNFTGSLIKTFKNNQTIDITDFSNGLYFLKIDSDIVLKIYKN